MSDRSALTEREREILSWITQQTIWHRKPPILEREAGVFYLRCLTFSRPKEMKLEESELRSLIEKGELKVFPMGGFENEWIITIKSPEFNSVVNSLVISGGGVKCSVCEKSLTTSCSGCGVYYCSGGTCTSWYSCKQCRRAYCMNCERYGCSRCGIEIR